MKILTTELFKFEKLTFDNYDVCVLEKENTIKKTKNTLMFTNY